MPDNSALYPQPPQQQPSLLSDPMRMIQGLSALQEFQLRQRQFPALAAQPGASLEQTRVGIETARIQQQTALMEQQSAARNILGRIISQKVLAMDHEPTPEELYNLTPEVARTAPTIQQRYPRMVHELMDSVRTHPRGPKYGAALLAGSTLDPAQATAMSPTIGPMGEETSIPQAQAITRAATGGVTTAWPPGAQQAVAEQQRTSGSYRERINPLVSSIPILEKMGEGDIGPLTEEFNVAKKSLQSLGLGTLAGIDPEKIKNYDELQKYMVQYASRAAQGLGPHTNEGLLTAVTGNPNLKMSQASALHLSKVNLGIERMQQALWHEFMSQVHSGKEAIWRWPQWKAEHNQDLVPSAFVYDIMGPEEQAALERGITDPAQRRKWQASHDLADRHGLIGDVPR
jgi:hypothetical protein